MFKRTLTTALALCALAAAQEIPPVSTPNGQPTTPIEVVPAPLPPADAAVMQVPPSPLKGVSAKLTSANAEAGQLRLSLTLSSTLKQDVRLMAARDNRQDCATAPLVRVLRVGSREVVYPLGSAKICTQDMSSEVLNAGGSLSYNRTLNLSAGEYMVESWFLGLTDNQRVKVSALPVRVTVK